MARLLEDVLTVMAKIRRFVEHDFRLGLPGDVSDMSPVTRVCWQDGNTAIMQR